MGWWQVNSGGRQTPGATGMLWGDELADIMDDALDKIRAAYRREWEREITFEEMESGFRFSHYRADNGYSVKLDRDSE